MRMLAVIACMIALPAMAQWPSWLSPMSGSYNRGNQALSGAVERLTVSYSPYVESDFITTNIWKDYFSSYAKLKATKSILLSLIEWGGWVFPTNDYTYPQEEITTENILSKVGAPTNWWTQTPAINLAGHSNGWMFVPAIMSNVVWIKTSDFSQSGAGKLNQTDSKTSWDDSFNDNVTNKYGWQSWEFYQVEAYVGTFTNRIWLYGMWSYRSTGEVHSTFPPYYGGGSENTASNLPAACETWVKISPYDFYSAQGDSVSTNGYVFATNFIRNADEDGPSFPSSRFGQLSIDSPITHYATNSTMGWYMSDVSTINKFNTTTNGFKWFR